MIDPTNSLEWSKRFEVLSISRLQLESLGIPHEKVASLSDREMDMLADRLQAQYISVFYEKVRFFVSVYLAERNSTHGKPLSEESNS